MTKMELAAKGRVYKRSVMALRRLADMERQVEVICENVSGADSCIVSRIAHNIGLVRGDLESLKRRNML